MEAVRARDRQSAARAPQIQQYIREAKDALAKGLYDADPAEKERVRRRMVGLMVVCAFKGIPIPK